MFVESFVVRTYLYRMECDLIVQKQEICVGWRSAERRVVLNFRFGEQMTDACLVKFASYFSYPNAH